MKTINWLRPISGGSFFRFRFVVRVRLRASGGILFFTALLCLAASVPAAETDAATQPTNSLLDVGLKGLLTIPIPKVSSVSKIAEETTKAPASVTVINADDIKKYGYRTLADLLKSVRGLHVSYDRNYAFLGVRGFNRGDYNSRM